MGTWHGGLLWPTKSNWEPYPAGRAAVICVRTAPQRVGITRPKSTLANSTINRPHCPGMKPLVLPRSSTWFLGALTPHRQEANSQSTPSMKFFHLRSKRNMPLTPQMRPLSSLMQTRPMSPTPRWRLSDHAPYWWIQHQTGANWHWQAPLTFFFMMPSSGWTCPVIPMHHPHPFGQLDWAIYHTQGHHHSLTYPQWGGLVCLQRGGIHGGRHLIPVQRHHWTVYPWPL